MVRKISIIKKEEAYSYDELEVLEERILPLVVDEERGAALSEVVRRLKASLENNKSSMAVFFMPQNTFNIFSLIQGDNSICKIQKEDIEALCMAFDSIEEKDFLPVYSHLKKKLKVLNEYLKQGNAVTPTAIQADNFSLMDM